MGPIDKALSEIRFSIPYEILKEAFNVQEKFMLGRRRVGVPVSIETRIREKVIDHKVMVDCNILGGVELVVPLSGLKTKYADDNKFVVTIPKDRTEGRTITSVLSIAQAPAGYHGTSHNLHRADNLNEQLSAAFMRSMTGSGSQISTQVRLLAENTILVDSGSGYLGDLFLRCRVESDSELSNLPPTSWNRFAKLCILATKAHIYNTLIVKMDEGRLSGGQDLGVFKAKVDEYADSYQLYNEFLEEEWRGVMALADRTRHERAIAFQFNNF